MFCLHPLAIASICDHITRGCVDKDSGSNVIVGVLFGRRSTVGGNQVQLEICDVEDAIFSIDETSGDPVMVVDSMRRMNALMTTVFPSYSVLGWYTVGTSVSPQILRTHQSIQNIFKDASLLCLVDESSVDQSNTLNNSGNETLEDITRARVPITLFEIDNTNGTFRECAYRLEADEVEKLSIDHVTRVAANNSSLNPLHAQNVSMVRSMQTLRQKLSTIIVVLTAMHDHRIPFDPAFARSAKVILSQLPHPKEDMINLDEALDQQINECYAISCLVLATKNAEKLNELGLLNAQRGIGAGSKNRSKH